MAKRGNRKPARQTRGSARTGGAGNAGDPKLVTLDRYLDLAGPQELQNALAAGLVLGSIYRDLATAGLKWDVACRLVYATSLRPCGLPDSIEPNRALAAEIGGATKAFVDRVFPESGIAEDLTLRFHQAKLHVHEIAQDEEAWMPFQRSMEMFAIALDAIHYVSGEVRETARRAIQMNFDTHGVPTTAQLNDSVAGVEFGDDAHVEIFFAGQRKPPGWN